MSNLEVADVFRQFAPQFVAEHGRSLSARQRRTIEDIERCRTAALGGHTEKCTECGHTRSAYNSCRNRHCPKCQGSARAKWLDSRESELLPVPYVHVVFTMPQVVARLALQNKKAMYDILFHAASETLLEIAADKKYLGAKLGFFGVLHTWGQRMEHHPHIHFVIPAGGLSLDGKRWVHCKRSRDRKKLFFLPVKVLSDKFRGKFISLLRTEYQKGKLSFFGQLRSLEKPGEFERFLDAAVRHRWVVYAKRPFGGPKQVLKYLSRYTHRVAISNSRLVSMDESGVTFRWKDYRNDCMQRTTQLDGICFVRRFLQHVLPKGLTRIRHCGMFSNRFRTETIQQCRRLLGVSETTVDTTEPKTAEVIEEPEKAERCPNCHNGVMVVIEEWKRFDKGAPISSLHSGLTIYLNSS